MKDVGMASTFNVMLNHSNEAFYDVALKKVCIQIILSLVNFGIFNFFPMYLIHNRFKTSYVEEFWRQKLLEK